MHWVALARVSGQTPTIMKLAAYCCYCAPPHIVPCSSAHVMRVMRCRVLTCAILDGPTVCDGRATPDNHTVAIRDPGLLPFGGVMTHGNRVLLQTLLGGLVVEAPGND